MAVLIRRPARKRRKYRTYALSRSVTFGPGLGLPLWGWIYLGEPLHWAGLAVLALAGLLVIPAAVVAVVFFLPAMLAGGLAPRKWRINHRRRHAAEECCYARPLCRIVHRGRHGRAACRSSHISASLRRVTAAADRNRCLYCGITAAQLAALPPRTDKNGQPRYRTMHVDHYRPWIAGFLTTLANMGLLCDEHNEVKSCYYRERNGYIWYHGGSRTPERLALAADIMRVLRWRRWSPLRLLRAAWALG